MVTLQLRSLLCPLVCLLAICCCQPASAQNHIEWLFDLDKARQVAGDQDKLVMIHFSAAWCGPCKELDRFVFVNPMAVRAISSQVVPVKIDVDVHANIAEEYGIASVPTDVLITPAGHVVAQQSSPRSSDGYIQLIGQARHRAENLTEEIATRNNLLRKEALQATRMTSGTGSPTDKSNALRAPENPATRVAQASEFRTSGVSEPTRFRPLATIDTPPVAGDSDPQVGGGSFAAGANTAPANAMAGGGSVSGSSSVSGGGSFTNPATGQTGQVTTNPHFRPDGSGKTATGIDTNTNGGLQPAPDSAATDSPLSGTRGRWGSSNEMSGVGDRWGSSNEMSGTGDRWGSNNEMSGFGGSWGESNQSNGGNFDAGTNLAQRNMPKPWSTIVAAKPADDATTIQNPDSPDRAGQFAASGERGSTGPLRIANSFMPSTTTDPVALQPAPAKPDTLASPITPGPVNDSGASSVASSQPEPGLANSSAESELPPTGLDGYCGVTLMEDLRWIKGDRQFGCIHRGKLYFFASQEHLDRFKMTPDMFSPLLGGADPVAWQATGQLVEGARKHGVFYGDEGEPTVIVLFKSKKNRDKFEADPSAYLQKVRQAMSQLDSNSLLR